MAELSDVLMMKALEDDNGHDTWGSAGFLWVILIFLFFLAFNGGGLFGNRGFGNGAAVAVNDLSQVERDVLTGNCATQKEVLENRYANQLSFNQLGNFYSKPSVNPNTCYNNYGCGGCNGCNGCGCN